MEDASCVVCVSLTRAEKKSGTEQENLFKWPYLCDRGCDGENASGCGGALCGQAGPAPETRTI